MNINHSISLKCAFFTMSLVLLTNGSSVLATDESDSDQKGMGLSLVAGIPSQDVLNSLFKVLSAEDLVTRGAKEINIFRRWSPAVVYIKSIKSIGSGALINNTGHVITNWHVVEGSPVVTVFFKPEEDENGTSSIIYTSADVVRIDKERDLALLRLKSFPSSIKPIILGSSDDIEVGMDVHAIGHPGGEAWTYTRGFISQLRPDYVWTYEESSHSADVILIQTPISPGNSGGPLLNSNGSLLGINSFSKPELDSVHYAVSVKEVAALLAFPGDGVISHVTTKSSDLDRLCGTEPIQEFRNEQKKTFIQLFDADCDGVADAKLTTPDEETAAITLLVEGLYKKTVFFDTNRDGEPDYVLYDLDGDNKADMVGYYKVGEDEPYRYEKWEKYTYLS